MVGLVEDLLVDRAFIDDRRNSAAELIALDQIGEVVPRHTAANAAAAAALARAYGVEPQAVARGLANFDAGDHRIQAVARRDDILWINDSKATNPHAANASLGAFGSVVWIAGGLSKGVDYNELVTAHADRLKAVILIGTDTSKLVESLERHAPKVPVIRTQVRETGEEASSSAHGWAVMSEAVNRAAEVAEAGDTVLMAPAAASMDQFSSYAQRGNAFIEAVRALMGEETK